MRKVDLFDEFKQKVIPNPLADWHRLDKCILKPGSTTPDDDGVGDADKQPDDAMFPGHVQNEGDRTNRSKPILCSFFFYKM